MFWPSLGSPCLALQTNMVNYNTTESIASSRMQELPHHTQIVCSSLGLGLKWKGDNVLRSESGRPYSYSLSHHPLSFHLQFALWKHEKIQMWHCVFICYVEIFYKMFSSLNFLSFRPPLPVFLSPAIQSVMSSGDALTAGKTGGVGSAFFHLHDNGTLDYQVWI